MPALAEDRLQEVTESLAEYSEEAVESAIDAAKDSDVARQFIDYLKTSLEDMSMADFTEIGLMIALSEAKAVEAVPVLLKVAVTQLFDTTVFTDAAVYALQRMGMPAFEEAMRYIQAPADDDCDQMPAFDVLEAAADCGARIKSEVADFCYAQLDLETTRYTSDEPNRAYSCCQVLVYFGDERVRPFLEREAPQDYDFSELLDDLNEDPDPDILPSWRKPWKEQCPAFGKDVDESEQDLEDSSDDDSTGLLDEPEVVAQCEEFARLVDEFNASPLAAEHLSKPGASPDDLNVLLKYGIEDVSRDFDVTDESDLREFLYEYLPRELLVNWEAAARMPRLLSAFIEFLHATGRLEESEHLVKFLHRAAEEVPPLNDNSANWGWEKRLQVTALSNGFDLTTGEGMNGFADFLTNRIKARQDAIEESEDAEPIHAPYRRESPKVGRNDPCPCGSGKKYKKCCAE